jgi:scyllo-inositol 2-dehydrogenase (NADP+)
LEMINRMENKIITAIASYGMSGQVFHGPLLKVNSNFEVAAVLERSKNLSRKLFPEASVVRSYEELLALPEVELVIVNTPDEYHYDMTRQALLAGKHVVVEKPATPLRSMAEDMFELARQQQLLLTVFQNRRLDGDFLTVKKVLARGVLGKIAEFESHYDRFRNWIDHSTWKENEGEYSGVLYNLGSHMVDQVYCLFGMPLAVTAHLRILRPGGKAVDYYDIRLDYKDFAAILKSSYLVKEPGPRYSIHGTAGSFHKWGIDPQEELLKSGMLPEGDSWGADPKEYWGRQVYEEDGQNYDQYVRTQQGDYNLYYNNIYEVLRNGAEPMVKPNEVLNVLQILEACIESNRKRQTIILD